MGVHIKFVRGEKNLYVGKSVGLTSVYKTKLLSAKNFIVSYVFHFSGYLELYGLQG